MIKASFKDSATVQIKYMDTLTDIVIDLEEDGKTVIVPQDTLLMLTSLKGTATVTGVPSPNKLVFHLEKEDYLALGAGEATLEFTVEKNVYILGIDISPSLLYNKVVDRDNVPHESTEPIIPALSGEALETHERADNLFNLSGYDI